MCSLSITELSLTCKTSRVSCKHLFESCEVVHSRSRPPPWKEHDVGGYASLGTSGGRGHTGGGRDSYASVKWPGGPSHLSRARLV